MTISFIAITFGAIYHRAKGIYGDKPNYMYIIVKNQHQTKNWFRFLAHKCNQTQHRWAACLHTWYFCGWDSKRAIVCKCGRFPLQACRGTENDWHGPCCLHSAGMMSPVRPGPLPFSSYPPVRPDYVLNPPACQDGCGKNVFWREPSGAAETRGEQPGDSTPLEW